MSSPSDLAAAPSSTAPPLRFIAGLRDLAPHYDVIFCDVWGVLHDGVASFPAARDALTRFRRGGGTVVLVSNAPRPGRVVAEQLAGFGVGADAFDAIVTSGDLTRTTVGQRAGQSLLHVGPDRDLSLYDGLDLRFASADEADYVVCTGLVDDETETVADYAPLLRQIRGRELWMLCANPDIVVERGARLIYCAGALAAAYEDLGGTVFYPGKPHRPIYERAAEVASQARRAAAIAPSRILAIGDAIRTDVAGAASFGIDSLLIARGIHAVELGAAGGTMDPDHVGRWLAGQTAWPSAVALELTWS